MKVSVMGVHRFGSYKLNPDGTLNGRMVGDAILPEILEEYRALTQVLIDLQPITMDYECVSRNRDALFQVVADFNSHVQSAYTPSQYGEGVVYDAMNVMNQHVNNFLSSSRAFVDHTETRLNRTFGDTSDRFRHFKEHTARLYDGYFSYRFLYRLRNYGTHCDLPVSHTNFNASRPNEVEPLKFSVRFLINRDKLLAEFYDGLNKRLRDEISALPLEIDLLPLLEEQAEWNRMLFQGILERERDRIHECRRYLNVLREKLDKSLQISPDEVPVIWQADGLPSKGVRMTLGVELIPFAHIDRIITLLMGRGPSSPIPRQTQHG